MNDVSLVTTVGLDPILLHHFIKHYKSIGVDNFYVVVWGDSDRVKYDEIVEQDNVKVIIDSKALLSIVGTKMNYTCNTIRSEFIFENPNAKMTCGCGESFMT